MRRTIIGPICVGLLLSLVALAHAQSTALAPSTSQTVGSTGEPKAPPSATAARIEVLGGSALALLLVAVLLMRSSIWWLIVGEDNRYSNSKFQMAIWFWTVLTSYIAALVMRGFAGGVHLANGVDVPASLLGLSGISALTFAGAKQIVVSRINTTGGAGLKAPSRLGPQFPNDLVTDDSGHRPDFGDFQMLVITLLAVIVYLLHVFTWLKNVPLSEHTVLPAVDTTILGTFGIGQGAYLAKKFTGDSSPAAPGPVLNVPPPRPQAFGQ